MCRVTKIIIFESNSQQEAVEHQEAAAERKKPSETHYDKTVLAGSSLGEIGVMARGRYLSKFADGLDIFSTVGLVAHPVLSVESLDVLRNKLKACGTFADLGTVLSKYAQEAPSGAGLRIALDRVTYWKSVGAQASDTVERLIKQAAAKVAA